MLVSLNVKNFAIIDNIEIDFSFGMTAITGETGAGKSLIIDAISLLLGARAKADLIRYGENKASITGVFSSLDERIEKMLDEIGVDYEKDENLIIKREIYANGKSVCKINSDIVSLNDLSTIGELIGDIHSQEDTFGLINPKNYLSFLQNDLINDYLAKYSLKLKEYKTALNAYLKKVNENNEIKEKEEFIKYQYNELDKANLSFLEEESLKEKERYLLNYNTILESINSFKNIYDEKDVLGLIYESLNYLSKLKEYDKKYESLYQTLEEAYYNIEEVISNNDLKTNIFDFDEGELESIQDRLSIYSDLKRKYKKNTLEIVELKDKLKEDLDLIENFDDIIFSLKETKDKLYKETLDLALKLRDERIKYSKILEEKVVSNLNDLELKNTIFKIVFNEIDKNISFNKDGIDIIDFEVSFNKGESMNRLSKVASGGELSRFMLSLKTVLTDKLLQQTKIFDEIDSGVSGKVAHAIALKIKEIAKKSQVFCITHLAQVASIASNHIKIYKEMDNGRTLTRVKALSYDERVEEIASMLSNGNITDSSISLAKELLEK